MAPKGWTGLLLVLFVSTDVILAQSGSGGDGGGGPGGGPGTGGGPGGGGATDGGSGTGTGGGDSGSGGGPLTGNLPAICTDVNTLVAQVSDECRQVFALMNNATKTDQEKCLAFREGVDCLIGRAPLADTVESACMRAIMTAITSDNVQTVLDAVGVTTKFDPATCQGGPTTDGGPGTGTGGGDPGSGGDPSTGNLPAICTDVNALVAQVSDECRRYFALMNDATKTDQEKCSAFREGVDCLIGRAPLADTVESACMRAIMTAITSDNVQTVLDAVGVTTKFDPATCQRAVDDDDGDDDDGDDGGDGGRPNGGEGPNREEERKEKYKPPRYDSVPEELGQCSNMDAITDALSSCNKPSTGDANAESCRALKDLIDCVTDELEPSDADDFEEDKCRAAVAEMIEKYGKRLANSELPKKSRCMERENVCGDGDEPEDDKTCEADTDCGDNFMCKMSYCCPKKKEGKCPPRPKGVPACGGQRCSNDDDCRGDDKKCCDMGCPNNVCVELEPEKIERGSCMSELEKAGKEAENAGVCGLGTSRLLNLPRCTRNNKYHPVQDGAFGKAVCGKPNGEPVEGTEHFGNRDCTNVRPGKAGMCPRTNCGADRTDMQDFCDSSDERCTGDQKCCVVRLDSAGECVKNCTDPVDDGNSPNEPEVAQDDCPDRMCCPLTLCQDAGMCIGHPDAVCRPNTCGGCRVEFFDADGNKVDCEEGITPCQRQREEARLKNTQGIKSDRDKIRAMLEARRGRRSDDDNDDEDDREEREEMARRNYESECGMDRMMWDDDDSGDDDSSSGDGDNCDSCEPQDEEMRRREMAADYICKQMDRLGICQNNASCGLTEDERESELEICTCAEGFGGLFCEEDTRLRINSTYTQCRRDALRATTLITALMQEEYNMAEALKRFVQVMNLENGILPHFTCDTDGNFDMQQVGIVLAHKVLIKYCVMSDGTRRLNSPVKYFPNTETAAATAYKLDCTQRTRVDHFDLPKMCRVPMQKECGEGQKCQFFFNNNNRMCEKGAATGMGFNSLTACYDMCGRVDEPVCPEMEGAVGICPECPDEGCPDGELCCYNGCGHVCMVGETLDPAPCADLYEKCDYSIEFCLVTMNKTSMEVEGSCQAFPDHCLLPMDAGYGEEGAGGTFFYFDAASRTCKRFRHNGEGGNANKFCTRQQCMAECGPQPHKYRNVACPRRLMASGADVVSNMCDSNEDCGTDSDMICCPAVAITDSSMTKICTDPVQICSSGERCSFEGVCDAMGKCMCKECAADLPVAKVCGSDGMTYDNECVLSKKSCEMQRTITVAHTGDCTAQEEDPAPETCPEDLPSQPMCAIERITDLGGGTTDNYVTFDNPCLFMQANRGGRNLGALPTMGGCNRSCGANQCEIYETCLDSEAGLCGCEDTCTGLYHPVCGGSPDDETHMETYSSPCAMRKAACNNSMIYVIKKRGPCEMRQIPEYECPEIADDVAFSATFECSMSSEDERCDMRTEMCCPVGSGRQCLPMDRLVRKRVNKEGLCHDSMIELDDEMCAMRRCDDDNDCEGDAKCCPSDDQCGHNICSGPLKPEEFQHCGLGYHALRRLRCDPMNNNTCPSPAFCMDTGDFGICCVSVNGSQPTEEDIKRVKICSTLERTVGNLCENGGTCTGNVENLCECAPGYYGPTCEKLLLPPEDRNCATEDQNQCFADPCEVTSCPAYLDATCISNYCSGGCHALYFTDPANASTEVTTICETNCTRMQYIWKKIFERLGLRDQGVTPPEPADASMLEERPDMSLLGKEVVEALKMAGWEKIPYLGEVRCKNDGMMDEKQCVHDVEEGKAYCYCKDFQSEVMDNAQRKRSTAELDCSTVQSDFPETCRRKPFGENLCRSDTVSERWYYSSEHQKCVMFKDYGCDQTNQNNFNDMETCLSTCSSRHAQADCGDRCSDTEVCRMEEGEARCKDVSRPSGGSSVFEPVCDADGHFAPKQCNGETCHCVDPTTGDPIADSEDVGSNLECAREGGTIVAKRSRQSQACGQGKRPSFCKEGGNSCAACAETEETRERQRKMERNRSPDVDRNGKCTSCQSCPGDQKRKLCKNTECSKEASCRFNSAATCFINTCDCSEVWEINGERVDCNERTSQCEIEKKVAAQAKSKKARGGNDDEQEDEEVTEVECNEKGNYVSKCRGTKCECVNPVDGKPMEDASSDGQDCAGVAEKFKAQKVKVKGKFTAAKNKNLADIPDHEVFKRPFRKEVEDLLDGQAKVTTDRLEQGSVLYLYELEEAANATIDVYSSSLIVTSEVNDGNMVVAVEGETFVASEGEVVEIVTEDPEPVKKEDDDDKKMTIIIVVVVVVVVVLLIAVAVGCYCMKKGKHAKSNDISFSNIENGKSNPAYSK